MQEEQSKLWCFIVGVATIVGTIYSCLSYHDRKPDSNGGRHQSPSAKVSTIPSEQTKTPKYKIIQETTTRITRQQAPVLVVEDAGAGADNLSAEDIGRHFVEKESWFVTQNRTLAEQGDAEAQYWLGLYYELGIGGLKEDWAEAEKWYNKAANQGHVFAKARLDEHCWKLERGLVREPWKENTEGFGGSPERRVEVTSCGKTGLPMLRSMDFQYPNCGYERVLDQFVMGDDLLVAPVVTGGAKERTVEIPAGTWTADDGTVVVGPKRVTVATPLDRLVFFTKGR